MLMESLRNHDGVDGNENVTEQKNVLWKNNNVKRPNFVLSGERKPGGWFFKFLFQINRCIPDLVLR